MAEFAVIKTCFSRQYCPNARYPNALRCRGGGRRTHFRDHPQNLCEQVAWDCDLGNLEATTRS